MWRATAGTNVNVNTGGDDDDWDTDADFVVSPLISQLHVIQSLGPYLC